MCTRYYMELSPELRPYIEAAGRSSFMDKMSVKYSRPLTTSGEVKPSDIAPVIATSQSGRKAAYPMVFGFPSPTGSLVLNARVETAGQKPMFREAWARRRCIVPASWYFEWQHTELPNGKKKTGEKFMFQPAGSSVTWICGLYKLVEDLPCFVILTTDAADSLKSIHDRMPLILPANAVDQWINPSVRPEDLLGLAVRNMVFEKARQS